MYMDEIKIFAKNEKKHWNPWYKLLETSANLWEWNSEYKNTLCL